MDEFGRGLRLTIVASVVLLLILLAMTSPAHSAGVVTQEAALVQALTVANGALQSCAKEYAEEYPLAEGVPPIKFFTDAVLISVVTMPADLQQRGTMAAVLPEASPKRIIVSQLFLGLMPPVFMGEVIIHEFIHLSDFNLREDWEQMDTNSREVHAQVMAKKCMDALWRVYPTAKPPDWVDGPRGAASAPVVE